MSKLIIFIQKHGCANVVEADIEEAATVDLLHDALSSVGIDRDVETFIFIDEGEEPVQGEGHARLHDLKHGSRVHLCRCRRIKTTVHFLNRSAEHSFPPGIRVRAVKVWAVHEFGINPRDAAEHVLQLCNSMDRPPSDTPLQQLVQDHGCSLCFDLVPEKRVEG